MRELLPVHEADWATGRPTCRKDNAMVICHALTGSSDVEDWYVGALSLAARKLSLISRLLYCSGGVLCSVLHMPLTLHATSSSAPMSSAPPTALLRRRPGTPTARMEDVGVQSSLLPLSGTT